MEKTDKRIQNEPIKHHFIPQFLLKNFTFSGDQLHYWNKETMKIEIRNTKSVFMVNNLYRDEKNHPTDPAIIEKKFSRFESEIATLFQDKIIDKNPIVLTRSENEKLRKFLYLLSFRSSTRKQQYIDANFDDLTKRSLASLVVEGDYVDLWLREIEIILDTDDYHEIRNKDSVSWPIKTDFWSHLAGYYLTFVTPRGGDFIIGDVYPTAEIFPVGMNGENLYPHFLFPISPNLMLIMNQIAFKPEHKNVSNPLIDPMIKFSKIKGNAVITPRPNYITQGKHSKDDTYTYRINKLYSTDVDYLNSLMLNEVRKGFGFQTLERIRSPVNNYQNNPFTSKHNKNDYSEFCENN